MNESWQFYETAMTWRHQAPGDDIRGAFGIAAWLHYTALCQPGGSVRRGAGAVERGGLENRCAFMGTQGSNPCLSANFQTVQGIPALQWELSCSARYDFQLDCESCQQDLQSRS